MPIARSTRTAYRSASAPLSVPSPSDHSYHQNGGSATSGSVRATIIALNYPPEVGAAAKRMRSLAATLTEEGYDIRVITQVPNYPQRQVFPGYPKKLLSMESAGHVQVTRIWPLLFKRRTVLWRSMGEIWFMLMAFVCSLRGPKPQFIFATCPSAFSPFAGWAASLLRRSCYVLEIRDLMWNYAATVETKSSLLARALEQGILWIANRAALLICTNASQQQYFVDRGVPPGRCRIVPNGVDTELLDQIAGWACSPSEVGTKGGEAATEPEVSQVARPQHSFQVTYVGLVGHPQGLRVLVDAARLMQSDPVYTFTVVGDGLERDELSALAEGEGLTNIMFVGGVRPEEVAHHYRQADLLVAHLRDSPAFHSALPSKLFEYMACGKPVVYGGCGPGADLIVTAQAGIVVRPDSAADLAEAIRRIASDPALAQQLGRNGYTYAMAHCRREVIMRQLVASLGDTLGASTRAA